MLKSNVGKPHFGFFWVSKEKKYDFTLYIKASIGKKNAWKPLKER